MLERCYNEKYLESYPSYIGTSVCSEWLYTTTFKEWMEKQDWQGKCLNKDIIVPRSKLYSPDTSAFVLQATNLFVLARDAVEGITRLVCVFINVQANIKPSVKPSHQRAGIPRPLLNRRSMRLGANGSTRSHNLWQLQSRIYVLSKH